jgi:hypothetical protein
MAVALLVLLLVLIGAVLILPRVPAVRRAAGVDEGGRDYAEISFEEPIATIHPSRYPPLQDDDDLPTPMRTLTGNCRPWKLRPVAWTADGSTWLDLPAVVEPITVIRGERAMLNRGILRHRPQGVNVHLPRSGRHDPLSVSESCPVLPGSQVGRVEELNLGISLGERRLVDRYSSEGDEAPRLGPFEVEA